MDTELQHDYLKIVKVVEFSSSWKKKFVDGIAEFPSEGCSRSHIRSWLIRVGGALARPSFNESGIMVGVPRRRDINQAQGR